MSKATEKLRSSNKSWRDAVYHYLFAKEPTQTASFISSSVKYSFIAIVLITVVTGAGVILEFFVKRRSET